MNKDDIISMAGKIAEQCSRQGRPPTWTHEYLMQQIMALVAIGEAAEREACASLCKELADWHSEVVKSVYENAADAIRARGQS